MEEGPAQNYFRALPEEIALDVLIYLDLPQLYKVSQVCKQFYRFTKDPSLHQQELFLELGQYEIDRQDYDRAIKIFDTLLEFDPTCALGYSKRGLCWEYKFETDYAIRDFERAIELSEDEGEKCLLRAYIHISNKKWQKAYEEINTAIDINPNEPRFYHQRAFIMFKLATKDTKMHYQAKELADYEKIITMDYNRKPVVYNNIGYIHYEKADINKAFEYYNMSIAQHPHHVRAYYNRTTIWEDMRNWEKALEDYNALIAINSKLCEVYYFRSRCYYQLNQIENSIEDCKYAVHNNKSYSYPLSFMYGLLISQNRIDEAEKELTTLMDECIVEIKRAEEIKIVKKAIEQHEKDTMNGHVTLGVEDMGPSLRSSGDISATLSETIEDFPKMVNEKDYKAYSELRISVQGVDKKLQRCKEFLQILYSLHAELSFMTGSLDAFTSDVVKLSKLKMTHPFVRALNGLLDTTQVSPTTVKLTRRMMYECTTREQLRDFLLQVYDEEPDLNLPNTEDQLYFVTVFAYRLVELYRAQNNNFEVLRQFWGFLKREGEEFSGFRCAVKSPLHLARLFEIYLDEGRWPGVEAYSSMFESVKVMCKHAPQTADKVFLKCFKDLLIDNPLVSTFDVNDQMDIKGSI
jgi:tetratricopeptide (TPR) repeat protein